MFRGQTVTNVGLNVDHVFRGQAVTNVVLNVDHVFRGQAVAKVTSTRFIYFDITIT